MAEDEDILKAFARRLLERALTPQEIVKTEAEIRQEWAGARVFIKRAVNEPKTQRLRESLDAGATLREAVDAAGYSRRTYYRLFRQRWATR